MGRGTAYFTYRVAYGWADLPCNVHVKAIPSGNFGTKKVTNWPNNQYVPYPGYDYSGYRVSDIQAGSDGGV